MQDSIFANLFPDLFKSARRDSLAPLQLRLLAIVHANKLASFRTCAITRTENAMAALNRLLLLITLLTLAIGVHSSPAQPTQGPTFSIERIRADVKYLSSDELQGRGIGSRGEDLAIDHIAKQLEKAGLKPAGDRDGYYQTVPLVLVNTGPKATLAMVKGGETTPFKIEDEFAGVSQSQKSEDFDADAIFVGHGITAPEFGWDDYKDVDVKGKVVVCFTNEPPSDDPKFFGGKALTYYGRWTYKYEEATRRGATAVLIIHTNETAGYPYSVVKKFKGAQLQREPGKHALAFAGWLSAGAGGKLLANVGLTVDEAIKKSDTRGFKAIPLGVRIKGHIPTTTQKILTRNVIAIAPGSDPKLKAEAVVFSAHWDHLGVNKAALGADDIYNGALDNATGSAILLEMARARRSSWRPPRKKTVCSAPTTTRPIRRSRSARRRSTSTSTPCCRWVFPNRSLSAAPNARPPGPWCKTSPRRITWTSSPTRTPTWASIIAPIISPSPAAACRRSPSTPARRSRANPPTTLRRRWPNTSPRSITRPAMNFAPTGISPATRY
jgi:hypothetical protein